MGAIENQQVVAVYENIKSNANYLLGPNPVKDKLSIHLQENSYVKAIKISSSTGQVIKFIENPEIMSLYTVDLSNYPPGLYLIHLENKNGTVDTEKIVKL